MDTVVSGSGGKGGVLVLLDRFTKFYLAEPLERISQDCVINAIKRLKRSKRPGKNAVRGDRQRVRIPRSGKPGQGLRGRSCCTGAYAAYGKGAAENASRFFRRRVPKGTDFSKTPAERIRQVTEFINDTPGASPGGLPADEAAAAAA